MREKIKCNEMIDGGMQSKQEVSEEKKVLFGRCHGLGDDVMDFERRRHGLGGNVMDSISGSSLESEELSQWKSVQAGIRADYSQYSQGIFETLSLEGLQLNAGIFLEKAFQQMARLGREIAGNASWGTKKEDGVFWSCSLVRLMGQVSADQEVPEVAAVCLEAPGHSDSVSCCGFPGTPGCLAPQADLIHFITSSIISHFMGSFWIPLTTK